MPPVERGVGANLRKSNERECERRAHPEGDRRDERLREELAAPRFGDHPAGDRCNGEARNSESDQVGERCLAERRSGVGEATQDGDPPRPTLSPALGRG